LVARVGSGQRFEGGNVREAHVLRLIQQALERSCLEGRGEVEGRSLRRRRRDAVARRRLAGEVAGAVDAQALALA